MRKCLILLSFIFIMSACGNQESDPTQYQYPADKDVAPEKTIVTLLESNPKTLNAVTSSDLYGSTVLDFMMEGLITINSNLEPIPCIATNWSWEKKINGDKTNYILTLNLRSDVYWQDGVKFTSKDVVFTYSCITNPLCKAENKVGAYAGIVEIVEAPDDTTVRVTYNRPHAPAILDWGIVAIPEHIYGKIPIEKFLESKFNRAPIGNGPYRIVKWETAQKITMVMDTNYWREKPKIEKVVYKIIADENVALASFINGEFDIFPMRAEAYENEKNKAYFTNGYNVYRYLEGGFSQIAWNCRTNSLFADKRVRQAMTYSIDRPKILEKVMHGHGEMVTGPFRFGSWAYNETVKPIAFDLEKAKSLLDEAGWKDTDGDGVRDRNGKPFKFEVICGDTIMSRTVGQNLKQNLSTIGVDMDIRPMEWGAFSQRLNEHNFDAAIFAWSLSIDPDLFDLFHSSQATNGVNYIGYNNPEADKLIVQARSELDFSKRKAMYRKLHEIIADDQPYSFMFCRYIIMAVKKDVFGIHPTPVGITRYYPGYLIWYKNKSRPTEAVAQ